MPNAQLFAPPVIDLWSEENSLFQKGISYVAGIDEAGRGPLAGPVVAATVIANKKVHIEGVNDSKKLSKKQRASLLQKILNHSELSIGIGQCSEKEIDLHNILQASLLAFSRAIDNSSIKPSFCLIDGHIPSPFIKIPQKTIIKGDQLSFLIAAASIVAKETRDKLMNEYHAKWPEYNFLKHKGYPTKEHLEAIKKYGICEIHRKSFAPVRALLDVKPEIQTEPTLWN